MDRCIRQYPRDNPSFSSTLLDAIYRSMENSNGEGEEELIFYRETMRKKHNNGFRDEPGKDERKTSLKKACMIDKWMEEKVSYEKLSVRRKSMADIDKSIRKDFNHPAMNSSSSPSESSSDIGRFSSSESESIYHLSSFSSMPRPKPIRTSVTAKPVAGIGFYNHCNHPDRYYAPKEKPDKHEGSTSAKTKSKALKIYGDLKKFKQPISPGGILSSFLNSLFTSGNGKKAKVSSPSVSGYEERKLKSEQTSTCSSASSFSRSCLSKTPSLRGNGTKRSVKFYPVSVILDEDSRPCGQKNLHASDQENTTSMAITTTTRNPANEELKVEKTARDFLKNHEKKKQEEVDDLVNGKVGGYGDEEEDIDAASYASSDLFELENLSGIGIERYRQELPVYETTDLDTNRAIARGLIL